MNLRGSTEFKEFLNENEKKLSTNKETVTLFFSFDLVNSSKYKMYSCNWLYCIKKTLYRIEESVNNQIPNSLLWRCLGDELIFTVNITKEQELYKIIQIIYEILYKLNNDVKNGTIFNYIYEPQNKTEDKVDGMEEKFSLERLMLGVKATAWIAIIKQQNDTQNYNICDNLDDNIEYTFLTGKDNAPGLQEFQGKDIDTGFRIAKHNSCERRLTLSLELAYILSKDDGVARKLHIISYKKLKGVFNSRLYPVIWYHDEYISGCSLQDSFYYDEDENNEIIEDFFNKDRNKRIRFKDKKTTKNQLKKIIKDINLESKIELIIKSMEGTNKIRKYNTNSLLEIHCVAVCYDEIQKSILLLKRKNEDLNYSNKWDFGCTKMVVGKSFKEQLKEEYENLLNIGVEILEPFKEFDAGKNGTIVPGIRFFAKIRSNEQIKLNKNTKYDDVKLVSLGNFEAEYKETVINEEEFLECIELIKKRFEGDD